MNTLSDRLVELIADLGLTNHSFEKAILASNATVQHIIKTNAISKSTLRRIASRFPRVNTDWILTGNGDMYLPSETIINNVDGDNNITATGNGNRIETKGKSDATIIKMLSEQLKAKDEIIEQQPQIIELLKERLQLITNN